MLESSGVPNSLFNRMAAKWGIDEPTNRGLAAMAFGKGLGPAMGRNLYMRLGSMVESGLDPQQQLQLAQQYTELGGNYGATSGAEYLARGGFQGIPLQSRITERQMAGGYGTAIALYQGGLAPSPSNAMGRVDEAGRLALGMPEYGPAFQSMANFSVSYRNQFGVNMSRGMQNTLTAAMAGYGRMPQDYMALAQTIASNRGLTGSKALKGILDSIVSGGAQNPEVFAMQRDEADLVASLGGDPGQKRLAKALGGGLYGAQRLGQFKAAALQGVGYVGSNLAALSQTSGINRSIFGGLVPAAQSALLQSGVGASALGQLNDPYNLTRMGQAGMLTGEIGAVVGGGLMDIQPSGAVYNLGQRNLRGIVAPGQTPMQFFQAGAQWRRQVTGGASAFSNAGGFQGRALQAANFGIAGLQALSAQVSYEGAMASAGVSAASARASYQYQTGFIFPSQRVGIEMQRAEDVGGFVQTDWMRQKGISGVDFGRGEFARRREAAVMQQADIVAGGSSNLVRLGWQLEDINRQRNQSRVQSQWQREDMAVAQQRTQLNRGFRDYEMARQGQELQISRNEMREDYATNRQIAQREFGWAMEDYDRGIRRSTGEQRRQLVRQRDRDTERFNDDSKQADKEKRRAEDRIKREEDYQKKQLEHIKKLDNLEDEDFKKAEERQKTQEGWREEDFAIREGRVRQEMQWSQEQLARSLASFKLQEERLTIEEQKSKSNYEMKLVLQTAEEAYAKKQLELALAAAGVAADQAKKQKAIAEMIDDIQRKQEDIYAGYEGYMRRGASAFIDALAALLQSKYGVTMNNPPSPATNKTGPPPVKMKALGGYAARGSRQLVGEFGPEIITPAQESTILPTKYYRPSNRTGSSSSPDTLVATINIGGEKLGDFILPILATVAAKDARRSRR